MLLLSVWILIAKFVTPIIVLLSIVFDDDPKRYMPISAEFLIRHFNKVYNDSISLEEWMKNIDG